jgi:tetratricopeptide (TPR) repeat protein
MRMMTGRGGLRGRVWLQEGGCGSLRVVMDLQGALEHHRAGRLHEAAAICRQALETKPGNAGALHLLGLTEHRLGNHERGLDLLRRSVALNPDSGWLNNLGTALADQGQLAEAIESFERSLAIAPIAQCHFNLGRALGDIGRRDEALAQFRSAISMRPDYAEAYFAEAYFLLLTGHLTAGWDKLEWRWRLPGKTERFPVHLRWNGEPLQRGARLLLHAEQGFGDTLQFCRYAQLIPTDGPLFLAVPRPLIRLLSGLRAIKVVDQDGDLPPFDLHCPLLSLPRAFRTTIDTIPAATHYLSADFRDAASWRRRLRELDGIKVGLVWAGGVRPQQPAAVAADRRRSIPFDQFSTLLDIPGVTFVSLQKDRGSGSGHPRLNDWTGELRDFADTAALIDALDLVVSVDTAVAHLAAALGKPTWLLNRFDTCWRWLLDREDSPWYPTLRQFRQPTPGDWNSVLMRVRATLGEFEARP